MLRAPAVLPLIGTKMSTYIPKFPKVRFSLRFLLLMTAVAMVPLAVGKAVLEQRRDEAVLVVLIQRGHFYWTWEKNWRGRIIYLKYDGYTYDDLWSLAICQLDALEELDFHGERKYVHDYSMDYFAKMRSLKKLDIRDTNVTEAAVQKFKAKRPDCEVLYGSSQ